jgi:hypothetical protein
MADDSRQITFRHPCVPIALEQFSPLGHCECLRLPRGVPLNGSRIPRPDHSVAADVLLRQEPDQEENEQGEEDDDNEEGDDDDDDKDEDGYSE